MTAALVDQVLQRIDATTDVGDIYLHGLDVLSCEGVTMSRRALANFMFSVVEARDARHSITTLVTGRSAASATGPAKIPTVQDPSLQTLLHPKSS